MRVGALVDLMPDVEECFARIARLGFRSGQLVVWDMALYTREVAREVKATCTRFDFTITAVWAGWSGPVCWSYPDMYGTLGLVPPYLRGQRVSDLLLGAEFARWLGVRDVVTHIGFFPDDPFDPAHIQIVQALRYIGAELHKHGQRFLFETGEDLPITLAGLIEEIGTDNMGINFDPANLLMNGRANPSDALELLGPYVMGVHGKDGRYPTTYERKGEELLLGMGQANYPVLIRKLRELRYDGDITLEREITDKEQQLLDLAVEKVYLEALLKEE